MARGTDSVIHRVSGVIAANCIRDKVNDIKPPLLKGLFILNKLGLIMQGCLIVQPSGKFTAELYVKHMATPIILHYDSAHPKWSKTSSKILMKP